MFLFRFAVLVLLTVLFVGCGGRPRAVEVQPPPPGAKVTLEEIAVTGKLPSPTSDLRDQLEGMRESDGVGELVDELVVDFNELISLSDPAAIQAKARAMVDKF